MSQKTRPAADVSTGFWSPTPIYPKLNGVFASSGSSVRSGTGTLGDACEVDLAQAAQTCCASATLSVSLRKNEAGALPTTVALLQGDMVIAGQEVEPSQSFGGVNLTLAPAQVGKITDPTALSVRVIAGRPQIGCCPDIPALLTATIHDSTCGVLNGVTVPLCWNAHEVAWKGSEIVCGMPVSLELTCLSGSGPENFVMTGQWGSGGCTIPFDCQRRPDPTCNPLFVSFRNSGVGISSNCPCCANTLANFDIDVTL